MPSGHAPHPLPISVLVGENTRIHSQLLADALSHDRGLRVIGAASTASEFMEAAARHVPDVVVLSASLDEDATRGLATLREFHARHADVPAVVLLDSARRELVVEAFRAGARGIFSKNESLEHLRKCVRRVHQGQVWANSREVRFALEALSATPTIRAVDAKGAELLSTREREVVVLLAEGLTNREIGGRLQLSQHTVKNYLLRIFEKLGVSSRVELLRMALTQPMPIPGDGKAAAPPLSWCRRAADQGVAYAQLLLAELYEVGIDCPRDLSAAYFWYCLCERTGSSTLAEVQSAKQRLIGALSRAQMEEIHAKADRWLVVHTSRRARLEKTSRSSDASSAASSPESRIA